MSEENKTNAPFEELEPAQTATLPVEEQNAAEAQVQTGQSEQPVKAKWQHIIGFAAIIAIAAAGFISAIFMCFLGYSTTVSSMGFSSSESYGLVDISKVLSNIMDKIQLISENNGSTASLAELMFEMMYNCYILLTIAVAIPFGIVLIIMLIVKSIQRFALKKENSLEKTAITAVLFFISFALLTVAMAKYSVSSEEYTMKTGYGGATTAGLIISGILFGLYIVGKIASSYDKYKADKHTLINGCLNLGCIVIATIVFILLAAAPVCFTGGGVTQSFGFNYAFASALSNFMRDAESTQASSSVSLVGYCLFGLIIQIWLVFQTGRSLHGAIRGTLNADSSVKIGSQVWRLILSVFYLVFALLVSRKFLDGDGMSASLVAPIVIVVFAVLGLVLAIVNRSLTGNKSASEKI